MTVNHAGKACSGVLCLAKLVADSLFAEQRLFRSRRVYEEIRAKPGGLSTTAEFQTLTRPLAIGVPISARRLSHPSTCSADE